MVIEELFCERRMDAITFELVVSVAREKPRTILGSTVGYERHCRWNTRVETIGIFPMVHESTELCEHELGPE